MPETLEVGVLCNNASVTGGDGETAVTGDSTEATLPIAGLKGGVNRNELRESMPEARKVSFDPSVKMIASYHAVDGGYKIAVKGAPEAVVESSSRLVTGEDTEARSEDDREEWIQKSERMAEDGLRVLALARKGVERTEAPPYEGLSPLGLVAMIDPPRKAVKSAIESCLYSRVAGAQTLRRQHLCCDLGS